jgi:uncharacterized membrane protein YozB (DUF420 family)
MKGFLGTPAPFMMDLVVVSLIAVVPIMIFSIAQAKKGAYQLHKKCQVTLAIVLFIAVVLFELEMRFAGGIKNLIEPERYTLSFRAYLWFHIALAISTLVLWGMTIFKALKNFDGVKMAPSHLKQHRKLGLYSTLSLLSTSVTGLGVYYWSFL